VVTGAPTGQWQQPQCCTVIGAAHRRLGKPCQDASVACSLTGPGGTTLQLMALADGHGGQRYWLSDVGSQLACDQAVLTVERALQQHPLTDQRHWLELLADDLPATIQAAWLEAAAGHWRQRPESGDQPFSPLTYGCTLGLVLLAPEWWGHTGLGDWDLVRRNADGHLDLISEEQNVSASGEATASLCMGGAASLCAQRAALHPLTPGSAPFALVLSTDGVRKSCATDGDFLALGHHLADLHQRAELETALAQITSQGSGDDVSVAIGLWGRRANRPPRPMPPQRLPAALLVLLGLGAAALGAGLWWLQPLQRWLPAPKPAASPTASLRAEVQRLCASPDRIPGTLRQRQAQFDQLLQGQRQRQALIQQATLDPLGAVIAASWPVPAAASPALTPALVELNACPALLSALDQQWQQRRAAAAKMPAAGNASIQPPSAP
jgi:serine/threonine protein phosphatase PrpC